MQKAYKTVLTKMLAIILGAVIALSMTSTIAYAEFDLSKESSITVNVGENDNAFKTDLEAANVVYDVYKLAGAAQTEEGVDSYSYDIAETPEAFQAIVDKINKKSASASESEDWDAVWSGFAQDAAKAVEKSAPATTAEAVPLGSKKTGLSTGLYLVIARGSDRKPASCFDTIQDENGNNKFVSTANSSQWDYCFSPLLVSIPMREVNGEYTYNTGEPGEWVYDYNAIIKPERSPHVTPTPSPTGTPTPSPSPSVKPPQPTPTQTPVVTRTPSTPNSSTRPVKTGDETQRLPYVLGMVVSGFVLLIFVFIFYKKKKDER